MPLARPRLFTPRSAQGMTLLEMLIASGTGSLLLAVMASLFMSGLLSFAGLGNYATLSNQSRLAMDRMSQEIREASNLVACQTNLPTKWLTITNAQDGTLTTYTWNSAAQVLTCAKTGRPVRTNLTGCSGWDFTCYQRSPSNNWTFFPTADLTTCKLISMSWKCTRSVMDQRVNSESLVTAQIVIRNKP